jgi:hypothetical protein
MKRDDDAQRLKAIISRIVETRHTKRGISPAWVATQALAELDRENSVQRHHPLVYKAAHLELRQLAREACREKWETDADRDRHPMFPDLQWRYPVPRETGAEPVYVLLEQLTDSDILFNVARLRADATARLKHADALETWGKDHPRPSPTVDETG